MIGSAVHSSHRYYLRLAVLGVSRAPWMSALMVLVMGIGIGGCITTLTVYRLLGGDPLPGKSAKLFYPQLDPETGTLVPHSPPDMMDYTSAVALWRSHRADRQAIMTSAPIKLLPPNASQSAFMTGMQATTRDFFPMFNVPFRYGGPWSAADDAAHARVAVISSRLNQRLFAGANSVGRELNLGGGVVRIVGVLRHWRPSPDFFQVAGGRFSDGHTSEFFSRVPDVYLPFFTALRLDYGHFNVFNCWALPSNFNHLRHAPCNWVSLWVQIDSRAKASGYLDYLRNYSQSERALGRFTHPTNVRLMDLMQWLRYNDVVPADVRLELLLGWAFLLICLINVAGLLLVKLLRHSGEYGLRRAIGAPRRAVFVQCLYETILIGTFGSILGLLLSSFGLWLVRQQPVAYASLAHLHTRSFLLALLISLASILLAGVWPAWRVSRTSPATMVKQL